MTTPACPACSSADVARLESINRFADAVYFRCRQCGHVWTLEKIGNPPAQHDVTPRDQDS